METNIYLHGSKESNYELGLDLGLKGTVLDNFRGACYEVKVTVEVDENTGCTRIIKINDRELKEYYG